MCIEIQDKVYDNLCDRYPMPGKNSSKASLQAERVLAGIKDDRIGSPVDFDNSDCTAGHEE